MNVFFRLGLRLYFMLFCIYAYSQTATRVESYFVKGNCSMCKSRIEKAAKNSGAKHAEWIAEEQKLYVEFDPNKTSEDSILQKIANYGHDNEKYKAKNAVYNNLPGCCLYDRNSKFEEDPKIDLRSHYELLESDNSEKKNDNEIAEVNITKIKAPTSLNTKEVGLKFNINSNELLKAACCNLSESFETNATVDASYSDAVMGIKQLRMLGLDQKYISLTKELLPEVRGLSSMYGIGFIPGRWISGIQLTKGGGSVVNGYEGITGSINTELVKPNVKNSTGLNLFYDISGRAEANIVHTSTLTDKWGQSILLHGNESSKVSDENKDGFMDRPKGNQLNFTYLLSYNDLENTGLGTNFGINTLQDKRIAGQTDYKFHKQSGAYGVNVDISRLQFWNKTGYIFKGKPYQSIGLMNQLTKLQQTSVFGNRFYFAKQHSFYSNLIFESIIGNTNNRYKVGASFMLDDYNEDYETNNNYTRVEKVPGIFAEYTMHAYKFTMVAGGRIDFHNLAGNQATPKINLKYDIFPKTILRLSAGRSFRTANIFAENQQYFVSNREIEIKENVGGKIYGLKPEIAWNYGISLQQEFRIFHRKSTIIVDYFKTDFKDQVVVDLDNSTHKILFYNLLGKSFAESIQAQWDLSIIKNLDVRLAYKYYDVQTDYHFSSGRKQVPFIAKQRGFVNLAYSTDKTEKGGFWSFDTTLNWIEKQRIPSTKDNPLEFQLPDYSNPYTTLSLQISKNLNENIRIYAGGDNLTNYKQKIAIIDSKTTYSKYFDAGMIYAPIMGANIYIGLDLMF